MTHNGAGVFVYEPYADFAGTDQFTYSATGPDGQVRSALVLVSVSAVNDAPVVRSASDVAVPEDGSRVIDLLALASDVDGDSLAVFILADATSGSLDNLGNGLVRYVPHNDYFGPVTFTFLVCDPSGACAVGSIGVLVSPVNDVLLTVPFVPGGFGSMWSDGDPGRTAASTTIVGEVVATVVSTAAVPAAVLTLVLIGSLGMGVDPAIAEILGRVIRR